MNDRQKNRKALVIPKLDRQRFAIVFSMLLMFGYMGYILSTGKDKLSLIPLFISALSLFISSSSYMDQINQNYIIIEKVKDIESAQTAMNKIFQDHMTQKILKSEIIRETEGIYVAVTISLKRSESIKYFLKNN
jgi:hypothetical protein